MAGYNRVGANLIGGIHAGLAIRQQRRAEAAEDSATALEKEAREARASFAEKWQNTFNPRAKTPKPAGTAPAPAAPAAPAAAIPAPTQAAPAAGTTPPTAIPTAPAASAAPAAPQEEYEFANRQDVLRLRAELFSHVLKYEGSTKAGIEAVKAFDEKLRNDGLNALKQARAAFEAKDYKNAALFGQLAASYSPDGYAPEFKVFNGKLAMVPRSEKTGEMAGDPIEVTSDMFTKLMQRLTMSDKEQMEGQQKDRELADKEKNTASQVRYRQVTGDATAKNADTNRMGLATDEVNAQANWIRATLGDMRSGKGGKGGTGGLTDAQILARGGAQTIGALKGMTENAPNEVYDWFNKGEMADENGVMKPHLTLAAEFLHDADVATGYGVVDKMDLLLRWQNYIANGASLEDAEAALLEELQQEMITRDEALGMDTAAAEAGANAAMEDAKARYAPDAAIPVQ